VTTANALRSIKFFDANNGTALGDAGTILRTSDGGISWSPVAYDLSMNFSAHAYGDGNLVWAVGRIGVIGKIAKSTDGGRSFLPDNSFPPSFALSDVVFLGPDFG